jgi:hypothetical protein
MPARFTQRREHFGPDVFMMFFIFRQPVWPDLELEPYPFHRIIPVLSQTVTSAISNGPPTAEVTNFKEYLLR